MDPKLRITDLDHSFVCLPSRVLNKNERYLNCKRQTIRLLCVTGMMQCGLKTQE